MNDAIWALFRCVSSALSYVHDIGRDYMNECRARYSLPDFLDHPCSAFLVRGAIVEKYALAWRIRKIKMGLSEFLDKLIPAVSLGLCELVVAECERVVCEKVFHVVRRWVL